MIIIRDHVVYHVDEVGVSKTFTNEYNGYIILMRNGTFSVFHNGDKIMGVFGSSPMYDNKGLSGTLNSVSFDDATSSMTISYANKKTGESRTKSEVLDAEAYKVIKRTITEMFNATEAFKAEPSEDGNVISIAMI